MDAQEVVFGMQPKQLFRKCILLELIEERHIFHIDFR